MVASATGIGIVTLSKATSFVFVRIRETYCEFEQNLLT